MRELDTDTPSSTGLASGCSVGQAGATHRGGKEGLLEEAHRPPTPPGSLLCPLGTPQLLDLHLAYPNLVGLTLTVPSYIFDARSGESLDEKWVDRS